MFTFKLSQLFDHSWSDPRGSLQTVIDEYTRKCLTIRVDYQLKSDDVLDVLSTLFLTEGIPGYIRSDNGSEFTAHSLQNWLKGLGVKTAFIEPGVLPPYNKSSFRFVVD